MTVRWPAQLSRVSEAAHSQIESLHCRRNDLVKVRYTIVWNVAVFGSIEGQR